MDGSTAAMAFRLVSGSTLARDVYRSGNFASQAEEPRTVPSGTSDRLGDRRQARIGLTLPMKAIRHDDDLMQNTLVFPHQNGADLQATCIILAALRQAVQEPALVWLQRTQMLLLNAVGQHTC